MSNTVIRCSLAFVGAAALVFGVAADVTVADAQPAGGHPGRFPFATRAESLKLARRLLAKAVVLPPGTRRFHGRQLPAALSAPPEETSATPLIDAHRVFTERWSMRRTVGFLNCHHPAGWSYFDTGSGGYENFITNEYVTYTPGHLGAAFSQIEMLVNVAPGRHGRALTRVDVQVVWHRHKPASDYLVAEHFRAVRVDDFGYGPRSRHLAHTFRQRAIIDKLTRVLNADPVAPGGVWSCPEFGPTYDGVTVRLTFEPVKGKPGAVVTAYSCPPGYDMSIGAHSQPALTDNGKIEKITDRLLRGSHQPNR